MLNWRVRYSTLLRRCPELADPGFSVLEVGCGPGGIARYLQRPVVGLESGSFQPDNPWLDLLQGSVLQLPFPASSFDFVVCVDVLEHLAEEQRFAALQEMLRVSRLRLWFTCPVADFAQEAEQELHRWYPSLQLPVPEWLEEHRIHGLPRLVSLLRYLDALQAPSSVELNESLLQHLAAVVMDEVSGFALPYLNRLLEKSADEPPFGSSAWDCPYSLLFGLTPPTAESSRLPSEASLVPAPALPGNPPRGEQRPAATGSLRIHCVSHRGMPPFHNEILTPFLVGTAAESLPADAPQLSDRDSPHRLNNVRWSELSAIYDVWQRGPFSESVGFCHYRRFFDFRSQGSLGLDERPVALASLGPEPEWLLPSPAADWLGPDRLVVKRPVVQRSSNAKLYGEYHCFSDLLLLRNAVQHVVPVLYPHFLEMLDSNLLYNRNLFVCSWDLFERLCSIWFPVLQVLEQQIPIRDLRVPYQVRDLSFLSERLFSAWILMVKSQGIEVIEQPIIQLI